MSIWTRSDGSKHQARVTGTTSTTGAAGEEIVTKALSDGVTVTYRPGFAGHAEVRDANGREVTDRTDLAVYRGTFGH